MSSVEGLAPEDRPSQADTLREWIDAKLDQDTKFYSLQSKSKQDRFDFITAHPELNTTEKKVKPSFHKILDERLKMRGINPKDAKVTRKKLPKFNQNNSDMSATIEPQMQGAPIQQPQNGDDRNNKFAPQGQQSPQQTIIGSDGQPMPMGQAYVNPNMTVDSIGALAQGAMAGIKSMLPDLEMLDDEEKKSIGAILLPPLSRISDERIQLYLFPMLGILGIIGPKIARARKTKKEKNLKKQKEQKEIVKAEQKPDKKNESEIEIEEDEDEETGKVGW